MPLMCVVYVRCSTLLKTARTGGISRFDTLDTACMLLNAPDFGTLDTACTSSSLGFDTLDTACTSSIWVSCAAHTLSTSGSISGFYTSTARYCG